MAPDTLEGRIAEIDALLAKGVLTNEEYAIRRAAIISVIDEPSEKRTGTAVLVLALIGAVFGVMFGLLAMAVGGIGNELEEGSGNSVIGLGISAILAVVFGVVCAGVYLSGRRRTLTSWGLLVAAVWHLVSISFFAIPGFIFLLLAAIFAWFGRKSGVSG